MFLIMPNFKSLIKREFIKMYLNIPIIKFKT
jgi:hypothetical protein